MSAEASLQPTQESISISNPPNEYYGGSKMNSIKKTTKMEAMKVKLSRLWLFATLNYIYADVMALMDPEILGGLITGKAGGGIQITEGFLLGAAILMEIPIAMVLLSRVLEYRANRWANIIAGTIKTAAIALSMFVGTGPTLYYIFFGAIEIVCTSLIVWYAWRWPKQEACVDSIPLTHLEAS
ncbi:MAG TPA: DUF6326 family protein [Anaerolineae bacterium]|nr:DUF6326 family protein [Anaerolineae bacterium]